MENSCCGHGLHRLPRSIAVSEQSMDRGSWLAWVDIREEFSQNKQLGFKGNFRTPYISVSHGFLLLSNIPTTNLNLLSSPIVTSFRLCQHVFKNSLWEFLGMYLVLIPISNINQHYNIYYYDLIA